MCAIWLGVTDAGKYMRRSSEWIEVRATPWEDEPVQGRFRYKLNPENGDRRYYVADLDAHWRTKPSGPLWRWNRNRKNHHPRHSIPWVGFRAAGVDL